MSTAKSRRRNTQAQAARAQAAEAERDTVEAALATVTRLPVTEPGTLNVSAAQSNWSPEQEAAFASIGLHETPEPDRIAYLHVCQRAGLDPFAREIYLIGRKDDSQPSGKKWTPQTGIDGFRTMAQRTGRHRGETEPQWCGEDGEWRDVWLLKEHPVAVRAGVRLADPVSGAIYEQWATCLYDEFVPLKADKTPMGLWPTKPAHMLAKCAKAQAYRAAYPRQASGIYGFEEMEQADGYAPATIGARVARAALAAARADTMTGVIEGDTSGPSSVVVDPASRIPHLRGDLKALITAIAKERDETVNGLTLRWAKAHRRTWDKWTDEELREVVLHLTDGGKHIPGKPDVVLPETSDPAAPAGTAPDDTAEQPAAAERGDASGNPTGEQPAGSEPDLVQQAAKRARTPKPDPAEALREAVAAAHEEVEGHPVAADQEGLWAPAPEAAIDETADCITEAGWDHLCVTHRRPITECQAREV